jgi:hypothetical protein
MKIVTFYKTNRSGNLLHIETEGCIVNIRVGLKNREGQKVTSVKISADKDAGEEWLLDGTVNNRVIKQ